VDLLEHAGFAPDAPDERALAFTCAGAPLEVLLVRAADIPEYVQDGAVDCGITGADLVRERGAAVTELVRLGYGHCTLECAVLAESGLASVEELDGLRVATSYPRLTRELLHERGIAVDLVDISGSVEVAPRLGLADAIVDLVSTGNTLRTNGLRSLGALFRSEAVLVGPTQPGRGAVQLSSVFRSVVQGRASRYLMLNAPESAVEKICRIVPGSRAPSVLPLSEPGMVAVHALVPAAEVWRLLPRLEAAGASSILLVPVERLIA
jgi:ATP phosphoribosyltransferase